MKTALVLLAALLASAPAAWGQERPPLSSDRPGLGTSADTVVRGALQLETGADVSVERVGGQPAEHRASWAVTVRYGLTDSLELRLEGEPIVGVRGAENETGFGDVSLGVKWKLFDPPDGSSLPTFSLLPSVKLPTASGPVGSERVDATLLGLVSFELGPLGIDVNAGIAAIGQRDPNGHLIQAIVGATAAADLTDSVKVLGEIFYNGPSERDGGDKVFLVAGAAWAIARDIALDMAAITTVKGRGPDYRLQAGITVRFWP